MITVIGKGTYASRIAKMLGGELNLPEADICIRYGHKTPCKANLTINKIKAIELAIDKLTSLVILLKNNLPVVEFNILKEKDILARTADDFGWPIFGRKINHKKGLDIDYAFNTAEIDEEFLKHGFFTFWAGTIKEYRVHVINNKTMVCLKYKIPGNDGNDPNIGNPDLAIHYIRNKGTGWKTTEVTNQKLSEIGLKTVKCLGLDFGAVDIVQDRNKKYRILEVNTAPGLDNKRMAFYIENFKEIING